MPTPRVRHPALALIGTACVLLGAWIVIPSGSRSVQAAGPGSSDVRTWGRGEVRRPARLTEADRQRPGSPDAATGVLDLLVAGRTIPAGSSSHARTVARLTRLSATMAPAGSDWSATSEVIDGAATFRGVPVDQHFELLLTGATGEELLKTTILGPGHGASPEYTSVKVSLGR